MIFRLLSYLPLQLLYAISGFLANAVFNVFGYRMEIIRSNIKACFPEYSDEEVNRTAKAFVRQFSQVLAELVAAYRFTEKDWVERIEIEGASKLKDYLSEGKSVLLSYGHFANWEWPLMCFPRVLGIKTEFLYHPLKNQKVNDSLLRIREKHGAQGLPKDQSLRHILRTRKEPKVIGLINDQIPAKGTEKKWLDFFGRETAFYVGLEKLAISTQSPVFYLNLSRISKGKYRYDIREIAMPPYSKEHTGIIKQYAKELEENIRAQPESYLWSHKRWKYTRKQNEKYLDQLKNKAS